jgi:hypothetical protein
MCRGVFLPPSNSLAAAGVVQFSSILTLTEVSADPPGKCSVPQDCPSLQMPIANAKLRQSPVLWNTRNQGSYNPLFTCLNLLEQLGIMAHNHNPSCEGGVCRRIEAGLGKNLKIISEK